MATFDDRHIDRWIKTTLRDIKDARADGDDKWADAEEKILRAVENRRDQQNKR